MQIDAIRMEIIHLLVETWHESCYKFCNGEDLSDSNGSSYMEAYDYMQDDND